MTFDPDAKIVKNFVIPNCISYSICKKNEYLLSQYMHYTTTGYEYIFMFAYCCNTLVTSKCSFLPSTPLSSSSLSGVLVRTFSPPAPTSFLLLYRY